jgi:hypothetical protein
MAAYKRSPRQGEYARRILDGIGRTSPDSVFRFEATNEAYIGPENALEAGVSLLHKYRPLGNLPIRSDGTTATQAAVELITRRQLYAASPVELNDVFEIHLRRGDPDPERYTRFLELVIEPLKNTSFATQMAETIAQVGIPTGDQLELIHHATLLMLEEDWRNARVISLSAKRDDPLMWSHYSSSHAGLCLGFRVRPGTMFAEALKVVYHDESPLFTLGDALLEEMHEAALLGKHVRWSYEDEWRIVVGHRDPSKMARLWEFGLNDLCEIVFGVGVDQDAERAVRSAATYLPSVRFGRMKRAKRRDELEVNWD